MQKILTAKQLHELDTHTITNESITSIDLMERACQAFVHWFADRFETYQSVAIVCGTGNNGGDGAGIARLLQEWGYPVRVWVVRGTAPLSHDCKENLNRLSGSVEVEEITKGPDTTSIEGEIIIDAIFGSGLSRPPEGVYAETIEAMNACQSIKVAVDIPSGLYADSHSDGPVVQCDFTVSFQLPKLAFLLPENFRFVGEWNTVNIGLSVQFLESLDTPYGFLQVDDIKSLLRKRSTFDHKGTYGRALLIVGSKGKLGAGVLASRAALRSGVGLLTTHIPAMGNDILQTAVPEAMVSLDKHVEVFSNAPSCEGYDAVGVGPGIGKDEITGRAFSLLLDQVNIPMVIDADGLNLLSENKSWLSKVPKESILTPHPKEFERLVGTWNNDFEKLDKLKELARTYGLYIILKGAYSVIASPKGALVFNATGNPGMATGGSGDVLTGILTSFLAQGYDPFHTCQMGVFVHGLSGDLASREKGQHGLIASDLVENLPIALRKLSR